jgi:hypothetical protein
MTNELSTAISAVNDNFLDVAIINYILFNSQVVIVGEAMYNTSISDDYQYPVSGVHLPGGHMIFLVLISSRQCRLWLASVYKVKGTLHMASNHLLYVNAEPSFKQQYLLFLMEGQEG